MLSRPRERGRSGDYRAWESGATPTDRANRPRFACVARPPAFDPASTPGIPGHAALRDAVRAPRPWFRSRMDDALPSSRGPGAGGGRAGSAATWGPSAYRAAGLAEALAGLGLDVVDGGDVAPGPAMDLAHPTRRCAGSAPSRPGPRRWRGPPTRPAPTRCRSFSAATTACRPGRWPASAGAPPRRSGRFSCCGSTPMPTSTPSTPRRAATCTGCRSPTPPAGRASPGCCRPLAAPVDPAHVCLMGTRSLDPEERGPVTASA